MIIIDMKDLLVGRVGTRVAKMALQGESISLINCDGAVMSGNVAEILASFEQKRDRRVPLKGPYYPKQSHLIVKRIIRGMLPYKTPKGRLAFERIKCYAGVPDALSGKEQITIEQASKEKLPHFKFVTVKRIAQQLGGKQ